MRIFDPMKAQGIVKLYPECMRFENIQNFFGIDLRFVNQ